MVCKLFPGSREELQRGFLNGCNLLFGQLSFNCSNNCSIKNRYKICVYRFYISFCKLYIGVYRFYISDYMFYISFYRFYIGLYRFHIGFI